VSTRRLPTALLLAILAPSGAALAYDGPARTPTPFVDRSHGPVRLQEPNDSTAVVSWNARSWAHLSFPPERRPDRVRLEVKHGSPFRRDTGLAVEDSADLVETRATLPLQGTVVLDFARFRGPGDYYVRIAAQRGGGAPERDVARRSRPVRVRLAGPTPPPSPSPDGAARNVWSVVGMHVQPAHPIAGQAFVLSLDARNESDVPRTAPWRFQGEAGPPLAQAVTGPVAPGATVRISATVSSTAGPPAGLHRFRGSMDPTNTANEPAEARADGEAWLDVEFAPVRAGPGGDRVRALSLVADRTRPWRGRTYAVTGTIRNATSTRIEGVPWRLVRRQGGTPHVVAQGTVLLPAAAQTTVTVRIEGEHAAAPGPHRFVLHVDGLNTVGEPSPARSNNTVALDVALAPGS
jgi:hypothetical protein